ncbi:hypothetical protein JAAARDRAFT_174886 [Jaapia argillacea MUCL 33604]|uniref:Non-ribosomal peptide synthetase n=1 Tax=Jaapia argillacea MUCL 33604 TaxID=933084 RepID=A0A067Q7Q5_9AGAM|nr:hypothetical protein JAAARDRAFT_174886 [Jaapia argillacea MUCL 33604]
MHFKPSIVLLGHMSALSPLPSSHPPYDDAEKGALTLHHSVSPTLPKQEAISVPSVKKAGKQPFSRRTLFALWFNTYRKLFTFVVTLNAIALGLTIGGLWQYPVRHPGALIVGNITFGVMMRNELFGRILYLAVNILFSKWTPLWWRLCCTSTLQHLGGIHSGCNTSGIVWLVWRVVTLFRASRSFPGSILSIGLISNVLLALCAISAFPWIRNTHHNIFERNHRFLGWCGLIATWIFIVLCDLYDTETYTYNITRSHIVRQQDFWFTFALTFFIVWPWIVTRKVSVDIELPSPKVAVIRSRRGMQQGLLSRISRSAVLEYHTFGVVSEGPNAKYHYLIVGVQGDFTRSLIKDPPTHLWTRQLKFAGVSNTSNLYRRGIRVCTGTGLGSALSTCIQNPEWYLIWIGSDQEKTYGPTINGLIHRHIDPSRCTLWDSTQRGGRPDVMKLIKEVYASWKPEVVFITSNFQGNREMMAGCMEAGIPAFGTLWDF